MTVKTSVPALDFVVFYVSDLDEALALFSAKLGLTHLADEATPEFRQLTGGEGGISFGLVQAGPHTPPAGQAAHYFKVADIESQRRSALENGLEATPVMDMPFGRIFSVRSADGHILTMLESR